MRGGTIKGTQRGGERGFLSRTRNYGGRRPPRINEHGGKKGTASVSRFTILRFLRERRGRATPSPFHPRSAPISATKTRGFMRFCGESRKSPRTPADKQRPRRLSAHEMLSVVARRVARRSLADSVFILAANYALVAAHASARPPAGVAVRVVSLRRPVQPVSTRYPVIVSQGLSRAE